MSMRKEWLARAAAAAVALAVATFPGPSRAQQMADDWVTVVLALEPFLLDGCNMNLSTIGPVLRQNVVETLTEFDPISGKPAPRLATSWEKINDTTFRFKLRQGVTFHDGAPFNAEAAAKGISRTMDNKELNCETRYRMFGDVQIKAQVVDEYTLDVISSKPEPILPTRMGVVGLVSPNTPMEKVTTSPIGTGPYTMDRYDPGTQVLLKRYEKYWGAKPAVAGAKYVWRAESSIRAAMVKIGEADVAPSIAVQDANDPKADHAYPNAETLYLRIESERVPFTDIRVRQALNYAFDWNSLHGTVLAKDMQRATQINIPAIPGHNNDLDKRPWPYDLAKAKALIAEAKAAGTNVEEPFLLIGRPGMFPNHEEFMEALRDMYIAIGLKPVMRLAESAQRIIYQNRPHEPDRMPVLYVELHDNYYGDPVFTMYNKTACNGLQSFFCDPALDELTIKATLATGDERVKLWQEINRHIYEDLVTFVWISHMVGYARVNDRVAFTPTTSINQELQLAQIGFKKK